ncbi:MAG: hypothetical protein HY006_03035 [Candidatus Sungbacteria bacterium]|nr:hypothetical protein [Candidatus Sungbacteria bacterium]
MPKEDLYRCYLIHYYYGLIGMISLTESRRALAREVVNQKPMSPGHFIEYLRRYCAVEQTKKMRELRTHPAVIEARERRKIRNIHHRFKTDQKYRSRLAKRMLKHAARRGNKEV